MAVGRVNVGGGNRLLDFDLFDNSINWDVLNNYLVRVKYLNGSPYIQANKKKIIINYESIKTFKVFDYDGNLLNEVIYTTSDIIERFDGEYFLSLVDGNAKDESGNLIAKIIPKPSGINSILAYKDGLFIFQRTNDITVYNTNGTIVNTFAKPTATLQSIYITKSDRGIQLTQFIPPNAEIFSMLIYPHGAYNEIKLAYGTDYQVSTI